MNQLYKKKIKLYKCKRKNIKNQKFDMQIYFRSQIKLIKLYKLSIIINLLIVRNAENESYKI